jgi:hypothetical protein
MAIRSCNMVVLSCLGVLLGVASLVAIHLFCGDRTRERPFQFAVDGYDWQRLTGSQGTHVRRRRTLQDSPVLYRVQLYISLSYVNDSMAVEFESDSPSSSAMLEHFCKTVNLQVGMHCEFQPASSANWEFSWIADDLA